MRDVVVLGAGPAGTTAATLLAQQGHDVLVLEQERFPRHHIGESLLPVVMPVLERLDVDLGAAGFLKKGGAEFIHEPSGGQAAFSFARGYPDFPPSTFQVERCAFDTLLRDRARDAGAVVREQVRVSKVELSDACVRVTTNAGAESARYFVDASGQSAFLGRQRKTIAPCHAFGRAAAYGLYTGLGADVVAELEETGNIKILLIPDGWAWLIPLAGAKLSVGFTKGKGRVSADVFHAGVAASPLLQRLTQGAELSEITVVGDFSFANLQPHAARTVCVGDSAAFLDPVFSSGVALAMVSATWMADLLSPALSANQEAEPTLMAPLSERLGVAYRTFANFINRFYNTRMVENLFFLDDPNRAGLYQGIVAVLAGDLWRDDNRFQQMLLASGRRRFDWPPKKP